MTMRQSTYNKFDLQYHENQDSDFLNSPNEENNLFFRNKLLRRYNLVVDQELRDIFKDLSLKLKDSDASQMWEYGVRTRCRMLLDSFGTLCYTIDVGREQPLGLEENYTCNQAINLIYLNIRGVLDNLACVFFYEKERHLLDKLNLRDLDKHLFNKKIHDNSNYKSFWEKIESFKDWYELELKKRRDPVAHKMPLYVIRQILNLAQKEKYDQHHTEFLNSYKQRDCVGVGEAVDKLQNLGKFVPLFAHAPNEVYKVYPTVTTDLGKMIQILHLVKEQFI